MWTPLGVAQSVIIIEVSLFQRFIIIFTYIVKNTSFSVIACGKLFCGAVFIRVSEMVQRFMSID